MHPSLWREVWILVWIALASLLLGLISGRYFIAAAVGFAAYVTIQLRHLNDLHKWLLNRGQVEIPEAEGLWGDVFNEIRKLMKQTERRQDELTGMIERFQSAASAMPDAVVIVSDRDDIEWANRRAARLLGIHYPRDVGMRLGNLLRDPELTRYMEIGDFSEPLELPSPANTDNTIAIQIIPFGARQKLMLARDVTRLHRLEQMRRHFVANVSHELRAPIANILLYLDLLAGPIPESRRASYLGILKGEAGRLNRLIEDLLTLSRLERGGVPFEVEPYPLDPLAAEVVTALLPRAALKGQALVHEPNPKQPAALINRMQMSQVLTNLIGNAIAYTPQGGHITVSCHEAQVSGRDYVGVRVHNDGPPIDPEDLPHLFERFYRGRKARLSGEPGTGLGLAICRDIAERHHGWMDVESSEDRGTSFTVWVPAAPQGG